MTTGKGRICSLDMLRGILVAAIFFFDGQPDVTYPLLAHRDWQGFSIAEVGVPLFAFMMGASMAISLSRHTPSTRRILRRVTIIFVIGVLLNFLDPLFSLILLDNYTVQNFFDVAIVHGRVFGVLQRLALTYLFAIFLVQVIRNDAGIFIAAVVLLIVSSAGFHVYAPDNPFSPEHNISRAVDYLFPGANHIYEPTNDPEGLYGTIGGTASVLFGYLAGKILIDTAPIRDKIFLLTAAGVIFFIAAGVWSLTDIVSKKLWTAPYALINAGLEYLSLALCMKVFDTSPPKKKLSHLLIALGKSPLFFFAANLIVGYFLYTLPVGDTNAYVWLYRHTTQGIISTEFGTMLFDFLWTALWLPIAAIFHRFNVVIKI